MLDWPLLYLISEWAIRLVMLIYVPQKRNPAAARTWLLLIFIFPFGGLLLYGLFGRAYMSQRRLRAQERISHFIRTTGKEHLGQYACRPDLTPPFRHLVTLIENLGDFGILGGNQVEILADYEGAINRLIADIDGAKEHVHLLYYIFADDQTGNRVADALAAAVKRGVACRVLIDSLGSKSSRRTLAPRMRAAGIEVTLLLPVRWFRRRGTRADLRNHRKITVVDGQIAYVGSQNLVNADFKEGITYEELVARVTGPVVLQLQAIFLADRSFDTDEHIDRAKLFPKEQMPGTSPAQVLPSGPSYPYANNQRLIASLIHAAQKRVVITTPYFIPDDAILQAMQTAVLRGVEVHLVVSRKADQLLVGLAQRSYYEGLLEAGVKIHLYKHKFLHAKHLSIDDAIVLVGSSNMDMRSFRLNAEISLLAFDPKVAADLRAVQERNFAQADLLMLEEWRKRPALARISQNLARLVDSVL
ncbi:MAG TPA: cardiolipin synthase [Gemmataceae bacterium]|nr:cardiolipin synthase [Gemmataceae bacterium]